MNGFGSKAVRALRSFLGYEEAINAHVQSRLSTERSVSRIQIQWSQWHQISPTDNELCIPWITGSSDLKSAEFEVFVDTGFQRKARSASVHRNWCCGIRKFLSRSDRSQRCLRLLNTEANSLVAKHHFLENGTSTQNVLAAAACFWFICCPPFTPFAKIFNFWKFFAFSPHSKMDGEGELARSLKRFGKPMGWSLLSTQDVYAFEVYNDRMRTKLAQRCVTYTISWCIYLRD